MRLLALAKIQEFLSRLDSKRAFYLFVIALYASVLLIISGTGEPWAPSIPVVLYGTILFFCQNKYFLAFSSTVKDSPYFLGFILTLVGLVEILWVNIAREEGTAIVITKVASAILPTVFGIFLRQLLMSWDSGDAYFDREYQTIADGLRTDAAKFRDSQARFVQLVAEFVKTREELLSDEEKVFAEYVSGLKESTSILSKIQRDYPKRLADLFQKLDSLGDSVGQAAGRIQNTVTGLSDTYGQEFEKSRTALAAARAELESQIVALQAVFKSGLAGFTEHAESLKRAASSHAESAALVRTATGQLSTRISETGDEVSKVVNDLKRLTGEVKTIDEIVNDLLTLINDRIRALRAAG